VLLRPGSTSPAADAFEAHCRDIQPTSADAHADGERDDRPSSVPKAAVNMGVNAHDNPAGQIATA
jgi:hypothetical protein